MRYIALACDYDGTLATNGRVVPDQILALEKLQGTGRKLVLVTGRLLEDLVNVFPAMSIFDMVVCENGGVVYSPSTHQERILGEAPPEKLVTAARKRGVTPLFCGRSIISTCVPHETTMIDIIKDLGLEWQIIFNNGSVMVLPPGINKASGLKFALKEMGLSAHNTVGVGDAENDHALLNFCEVGAAVANAIPTLKERADIVTEGECNAGVNELVDRLITNDLSDMKSKLPRHNLKLGSDDNGTDVMLNPYRSSLMVAGASGSGKSTVAHSLMERLSENNYQFCLIDPEGDYQALEHAVTLGGSQRIPTIDEIMHLLNNPSENAVVNLLGVPLIDRPNYFNSLLPHLHEFNARTGRPHWLVIDEAHHLMPFDMSLALPALQSVAGSLLMVTVHPEHVCAAALSTVDALLTVGRFPQKTIRDFCVALGLNAPSAVISESNNGHVVAWLRSSQRDPFLVHVLPCRQELRRHRRKYAQGDVGKEKSFVFRGPDDKLKLWAQNLLIFLQMAEGVDNGTWLYHLRRQDYSRWFQDAIKDDELAARAAQIELDLNLSGDESLRSMKVAVEQRYGAPE